MTFPPHPDWVNGRGEYDPPVLSLSPRTLIFDRERNEQVMWIDGVLTLPIGAEVELVQPNVNAVVTGVRLLAGTKTMPVAVCIDVRVPPSWWGERMSTVVVIQNSRSNR